MKNKAQIKKSKNRTYKGSVFHRRLDYPYPIITHGKGIHLYDEDNKEYLDACGGAIVASIGHGVKEIAEKTKKLLEKTGFIHASQFTTKNVEDYARELCRVAPKGLSKVYFTLGGSDAVETAIKLARQYHYDSGNKGKYKINYTYPSYHGGTFGALAITPKKSFREIYEPYLIKHPKIPSYFCYHCPYKKIYPKCDLECAWELEKIIKKENPKTISAFIIEPIIGASAGAVVPPKEYLPIVKKICAKYNILLIADEVMSGCGRTGKWFACQHFGIKPDILITAKGISGGLVPLSAVFCTDKIYRTIKNGTGAFSHGYTYVNNPITVGIGKAVFEYTNKNKLVDNCAKKGEYLLSKLRDLAEKFEIIGDVRGKGLMTAIEFVRNRETKEPFPRKLHLAERILQTAMKKGLNLYFCLGFVDGVNGDAVMIAPPFTVTKSEIDKIINILSNSIKEVQKTL
jgi:adenosylmethionine-8-amino-7-oxononanoate aminotransferase